MRPTTESEPHAQGSLFIGCEVLQQRLFDLCGERLICKQHIDVPVVWCRE